MFRRTAALLIALSAAACSADSGGISPPGPNPSVVIENESQYQLRELRLHSGEDYRDVPNLIGEPIAVGEMIIFYGEGTIYFTIFREKNEGGQILAFTTAQPFKFVRSHGYHVSVFDDSFRLTNTDYLPPEDVEGLTIIGNPTRTSTTGR